MLWYDMMEENCDDTEITRNYNKKKIIWKNIFSPLDDGDRQKSLLDLAQSKKI